MLPKIYFYTTSQEGPPEGAYFQDLLVNLATGFKQLGIKYYASNNYWQIHPDCDRTLIEATPEVQPTDCDIVVLERQWYEENGCLPLGLFTLGRQYKTVYFDCNDGIKTPAWQAEFRQFDFILKTHYVKHVKYPDNFYPWAFGLSKRVLQELEEPASWAEKQPSFLINFRNKKFNHSVRSYVKKSLLPRIAQKMAIDSSSDGEAEFPHDHYHYLRWAQTGRRHYPNYFQRLKQSQACACFGGFFLGPRFIDDRDRLAYYFARLIDLLGIKTNRLTQWDSWRFWESMAAGCVTLHVDFAKYGFELPVMPENWRHYIGIDLDNIGEFIDRMNRQPEILQAISAQGRAWAIEHYSPLPTAIRFLKTVAGIKSEHLQQLQPEVNLTK